MRGRIIESAGVHVTIDAFVHDPKVFGTDRLRALFHGIVEALNMTILIGPDFIEVPIDIDTLRRSQETGVFEDEGGITGLCVINKSHIAIHCWPLQEFFSMDVFSCGDYDPEVPLALVRSELGVKSESVQIINRRKPVLY
jgi:S-adenosylmethionine/arginine decarboxylase-like enzyme